MATLPTLRPGDASPFVELMQLALSRAGYDPGAIDGVFGRRTRAALLSFQRAFGLAPDGVAGPLTWRALTPYLTGFVTHTLKRGDTFYRLAERYGATASAVAAANPALTPQNLPVGEKITIPLGFRVVPENVAFTPTALSLCCEGLAARYPFLSLTTAGKSVLGRPLYALSFGKGQREVFYNGAHHANEWITALLLVSFLESLCEAYIAGGTVGGESAETLYDACTLYLMPMVNPDGVALVTGELASGDAYRRAVAISADYPAVPFPRGWKANLAGTDPNLQYPAGWEEARRLKFAAGWVSPAPRDYVGPSPLSAPESRAVFDLTRAHDFALTISYHTQGGVIYWRYGDRTPEESLPLAREFARLSGYEVAEVPYESGFAGYKDWFIDAYGRPGFTIEAGQGLNPLPLSDFPAIYRENEGILVQGMRGLDKNMI